MDELGLWENTVVVILSDHGEEFWDHFAAFGDHGHSLYGEQINIPLMIYDPRLCREGLQMVQTEATNVDLVPTVLDLLGVESPLPFDGTSLVPVLQGKEIQRKIPIMATLATEQSFASPEITRACIVVGGKKFISPWFDSDSSSAKAFHEPDDCRYYPPAEELFLLGDDPEEGYNVNADDSALSEEMKILLQEAFHMALPAYVPEPIVPHATGLSPDIRRQLETLGYVEN
jgi:arylsulfatase A-like enzyme